ncbi:phosphatidate cytidylyltransferase, mitochondrial-like isoform X1 [Artemia franciscana]|uniref:Phosphatidate cytidylyltransferase, mitochondrial n=3 Tax=Artemia franciscana TaxID=6661 RepID=A0AA88IB85_ARTSF|nr:hypothetical protein QYM36_008364 [Artemia franciscana]
MAIETFKQGILPHLKLFPAGICFTFAYGSGVFKQKGHNSVKDNMVDLIFVAENPLSWHTANIERNPKHYSFLRYMGSKAVTAVQNFGAAKIYFNTLVPVNNAVIKYGVVSRESFIEDLLDWNSLYVSGRLHKPVLVLQNYDDGDIKMALEQNLYSALHASLLLLPESFTEERLYHTLASLSYRGDFRMKFGEDRSKVSNIVKCQMEHFRSLYEPVIKSLDQWVDVDFLSGKAEQDVSPSAKLYHLNLLPKTLQMGMLEEWSRDGKYHDLEDILRAAAYDTECGDLVNAEIEKIVNQSSWSQSIKGVLTAGIFKSIKYSAMKVSKMMKSLNKT